MGRGAVEGRRGEARRGQARRWRPGWRDCRGAGGRGRRAKEGGGPRRAEGLGGRRPRGAEGLGGRRPRGVEGHLFDEAFLHRGEGPPLPLRVLLRGPVRRRFPRGSLAVAAAAAAAAAARGAVGRDGAQRRRSAVAVGRQPRLVRVWVRVRVRIRVQIRVGVRVRARVRVSSCILRRSSGV